MLILLILHLVVTLALIGVILLQHSEGGGLGMGGGGNAALFTARGTANLLTRATAVLAALFIGNCLLMTILSSQSIKSHTDFLKPNASTPAKGTPPKDPVAPTAQAPVTSPVQQVAPSAHAEPGKK